MKPSLTPLLLAAALTVAIAGDVREAPDTIRMVGDGEARPFVPALYVFGDGTVDVGNNNDMDTVPKANFLPYGIDFPQHGGRTSTGRFSNGHNLADFIAINLRFKLSPPTYHSVIKNASSQIDDIMDGRIGVNFASGGSGVLDTSGDGISLGKQVENFARLKEMMLSKMDSALIDKLFSESFFLISIGTSDLLDFIHTSNFRCFEFIYYYQKYITELYKLGARRFGLVDVAPLGCFPLFRTGHHHECNETVNAITETFNDAIRYNVIDIPELHDAKYAVARSFQFFKVLLRIPKAMGVSNVKDACCDNGSKMCTPDAAACEGRDEHLFWDAHHMTESPTRISALAFFHGITPEFAYPITFEQLLLA